MVQLLQLFLRTYKSQIRLYKERFHFIVKKSGGDWP